MSGAPNDDAVRVLEFPHADFKPTTLTRYGPMTFPSLHAIDEASKARICRALCTIASIEDTWSQYGPTEKATQLWATRGGGLTAGQHVYFEMAWLLWDEREMERHSAFSMYNVLLVLNGRHLRPLADLLVALSAGPGEVETWLGRYDTGIVPIPLP